jgi:hypothetical protein
VKFTSLLNQRLGSLTLSGQLKAYLCSTPLKLDTPNG